MIIVRVRDVDAPGMRDTVELLNVAVGGTIPVDGVMVSASEMLPVKPELVRVTSEEDWTPAMKLEGDGVDAEIWNMPVMIIETVTV